MVDPCGWIKMMALKRFTGFIVLLVFCHRTSSLNCGWPGKPNGGILLSPSLPMPAEDQSSFISSYIQANRVLSYEYLFQEGQVVSYQCRTERQDVLRGTTFNRTCQADGRWSGTRPWCDLNVAYGKSVTYTGMSSTTSDILMTDGLISSEDPLNTAECPTLGKSGAYFSVNLEDNFPVRVVGVYGKIGEGMNNLEHKRITLGLSTNCPQVAGNASAFGYQCNREQSEINTADLRGSTVRFDHGSSFMVDICEVVVYTNPTLADCGEPEIPAFGEVAITTGSSSQEARYHCRYGYELQGSEIRTCKGRTWSNEQPICVEMVTSSTTENIRNTTNIYVEGGSGSGSMDPFQIVLIVVCVALALGLIVALIVLLKFGRLSCCGTYGSTLTKKLSKKKKPPPTEQSGYQKVTTNVNPNVTSAIPLANTQEEANKRAAAMAAAEQERQAEERDFVNTRLAYQNERTQQSGKRPAAPPPAVTYAELTHDFSKRVPDSPAGHSLDSSVKTDPPISPVYAQVYMRASKTEGAGSSNSNKPESSEQSASPPVRKSYIPPHYLKESPEVQMKTQALNDQLKQAVRISRNTDF